MTAVADHERSAPATDSCAHCGMPLGDDQEWCLESGASRTLIHRPPDCRIPLAIIAVVVVLVIGAFVLVIERLSSNDSPATRAQSQTQTRSQIGQQPAAPAAAG